MGTPTSHDQIVDYVTRSGGAFRPPDTLDYARFIIKAIERIKDDLRILGLAIVDQKPRIARLIVAGVPELATMRVRPLYNHVTSRFFLTESGMILHVELDIDDSEVIRVDWMDTVDELMGVLGRGHMGDCHRWLFRSFCQMTDTMYRSLRDRLNRVEKHDKTFSDWLNAINTLEITPA